MENLKDRRLAKKLMKDTPKTSPLSLPIAKDKTNRKSKADTNGEKIVCAQTIRNLKHSFLYSAHVPIQLIKPNLLVPILYFEPISTMSSVISFKFKKTCAKLRILSILIAFLTLSY